MLYGDVLRTEYAYSGDLRYLNTRAGSGSSASTGGLRNTRGALGAPFRT